MAIPDPVDYIGANADWDKFSRMVSDNTGQHYLKMWLVNARKNEERVKKHGWATEILQDAHYGKTAVLIGGSPHVATQLDTLRELQDDPGFILIGITSNLKFLLTNGIRPRYVMIADAEPAMVRFWKDVDMDQTKDIVLITSICTLPEMLDMWCGPMYFLAIYSGLKKIDKTMHRLYNPVNGCGALFHALCSQYNTGTAFAYNVFQTKILIFVGNELGFKDKDIPYYPDRKDYKDNWIRKPHMDIYGGVYYSNYMLMSLKLSLEDYLGKICGDGWFFNCTEAGIFGVSARHNGHLPWIKQLTLKAGLMQARMIMQTGQPFYLKGA